MLAKNTSNKQYLITMNRPRHKKLLKNEMRPKFQKEK